MTALANQNTFFTVPLSERTQLKATEERLEQIYQASKLGLKGDTLAMTAGLMPVEFNRLKQMDPLVEMAVLKGKADGEAEMATVLVVAAKAGDAKAALDVLKHAHGWQAAQQVNVSVQGQISITSALQAAEARVRTLQSEPVETVDATYTEIPAIPRNAEKVTAE